MSYANRSSQIEGRRMIQYMAGKEGVGTGASVSTSHIPVTLTFQMSPGHPFIKLLTYSTAKQPLKSYEDFFIQFNFSCTFFLIEPQ